MSCFLVLCFLSDSFAGARRGLWHLLVTAVLPWWGGKASLIPRPTAWAGSPPALQCHREDTQSCSVISPSCPLPAPGLGRCGTRTLPLVPRGDDLFVSELRASFVLSLLLCVCRARCWSEGQEASSVLEGRPGGKGRRLAWRDSLMLDGSLPRVLYLQSVLWAGVASRVSQVDSAGPGSQPPRPTRGNVGFAAGGAPLLGFLDSSGGCSPLVLGFAGD